MLDFNSCKNMSLNEKCLIQIILYFIWNSMYGWHEDCSMRFSGIMFLYSNQILIRFALFPNTFMIIWFGDKIYIIFSQKFDNIIFCENFEIKFEYVFALSSWYLFMICCCFCPTCIWTWSRFFNFISFCVSWILWYHFVEYRWSFEIHVIYLILNSN